MSEVIVVTDKYAAHAGGTAVCWTEWVRRWPLDKVTVITRHFNENDRALSPSCRTIRVPFIDIPKLRMPLLWITMFGALLLEILRARPKAIHFGQVLETGWMGVLCKFFLGIPYIITLHGEEVTIYSKRPFTRKALNFVLAHSAGVGVNTEFTASLVRRHTDYSEDLVVAYPGVDRARFHGPHGGGDQSPVLVTLGRVVPRKGHATVIQVLPRLLQEFPDLTYVILGDGSEKASLQNLVRDLGLSTQVAFAGHTSEAEVVQQLCSARIFVHPNKTMPNGDVEGFGIVFLEANACGLPVIGGNSGGTPEAICQGRSGFLVNPEDPDELTRVIGRLLREPDLWKSISSFGEEWSKRFSWERSAQALWELTQRQTESNKQPKGAPEN